MSLKSQSGILNGPVRPQDVVEFLHANPTFLDEHPDLLRALSIPHQRGAMQILGLRTRTCCIRRK